MSLFSDDRASELRDLFFESATELLQALNDQGLELEQRPGDAEVVRSVRRTVHTLKGDSAACGFQELSSLAHEFEDALTPELAARAGAALADVVLSAADTFDEMLQAYRSHSKPPAGNELRAAIKALVGASVTKPVASGSVPAQELARAFPWSEYEQIVIADALKRGLKVMQIAMSIDPHCLVRGAALQLVRNTLQDLGTILLQIPEESAADDSFTRIQAAITTSYDTEHVARKCRIPAVIAEVHVELAARADEADVLGIVEDSADVSGMAQTLAASLTMDEVLNNLMEMVAKSFQPDTWSLLLVDFEKHDLYFAIVTGPAAEKLKKVRLKMGEGIAGWVAQHGEPVIAPDVYSDPRFAKRIDEMAKFKTHSMICVPMRHDHRTLGVIQLINCPVDKFDEKKMSFLQTLCDYAAAGIDNIRHAQSTIASPSPESSGSLTSLQDNILRLDAERIDAVLNLVGEMIIGKSMLTQTISEFDRKFAKDPLHSKFADALAFQARVLNDLQKSVMKIRMVPVEQLFRRFPRMVRDVAKLCDKDVQLIVTGQDTDLDKSILDSLAEPMAHLVRNAIGHGIEPAAVRVAAGKPAHGTVKLFAYHQGNEIVIEVADDGCGIDRDKVISKAIERGIVSADEAPRLSEADALNLIFHPGFTTVDQVTSVSGRGVGMDVVKSVLDRLKGSVRIDTKIGAGTRFFLKVPLTLAIIKALMFRVADKLYAVPLNAVVEITRATESEVHLVDQREVIRLREEVLPLIRLNPLTDVKAEKVKKLFIVVISLADRKFGLLVDRLVGEEELVIKALDDHLVATELVSGASILGDGTVVLILNMQAVVARLGRVRSLGASA